MIIKKYLIINILVTGLLMLTSCGSSSLESDSKASENDSSDNEIIVEQLYGDDAVNSGEDMANNGTNEDKEIIEEYFEKGDLLTDPVLMNQTEDSISVVWFTEGESARNIVLLYEDGESENPTDRIEASSIKLSRMRGGDTLESSNDQTIIREIYRHEAVVSIDQDLEEIPYRVISDGLASDIFSLRGAPKAHEGAKILLTSDMQIKTMCAANIEKVGETIGQVDAVLANGDVVDVIDRAYDWFYADNAFFKVMQGRASSDIEGKTYAGSAILQNAPIYASIGNHDVMGVLRDDKPLDYQFNNPKTREYAEELFEQDLIAGSHADINTDKGEFIKNNSFNTDTWEEIFTHPNSSSGDEKYYAFTLGNTRIIVLYAARVWRLANIGLDGKYSEIPGAARSDYGFGEFIFEPVKKGSDQYKFLENELKSEDYKNAKYHVVMYHFDSHSLGGNAIPAFTDPVEKRAVSPITGQDMVIYDYPISEDYLLNDVEPLLEEYGVDLLFNAHSHVWNRFKSRKGMNILQTSNVGNSYGCFNTEGNLREFAPTAFNSTAPYYSIRSSWNKDNYVLAGDPGGLSPIAPSVKALPDNNPYLASNTITAFSILDTNKGIVESYYFDTKEPDSQVVLFDSFSID